MSVSRTAPSKTLRKKEPNAALAAIFILATVVCAALYFSPIAKKEDPTSLNARLLTLRKGQDPTSDMTPEQLTEWNLALPRLEDKTFPLDKGSYKWGGGFGAPRGDEGERLHEGVDLLCAYGQPLHSVSDGVVTKIGWLTLGGWRIGVQSDDGVYYYYAHLSVYAPGLDVGSNVYKGQLIGYAGDSGKGPEGTVGLMEPHLHFGMYVNDIAIDAEPYLKQWEYEMLSRP